MTEKTLPQNTEAEESVLGAIIIDPEAITLVADFLRTEDFYRDAHRMIYSVMLDLYNQHMPADCITLCDELERRSKIEGAGGISYIMGLVNNVPTSANVEYYGRIVARDGLYRRLIHAAGQIATLAYERTENALQLSEQILFQVDKRTQASGFSSMSQIMLEYMQQLDVIHDKRGTLIGIPTGYKDLDTTLGGLQKTDLVILAGRPSMGKSALGVCMAYNAALQGKKIALFSLEMGKYQLATRLMAMDSTVDMQQLRNGWIADDEWDSIVASSGKLSELPIWINDTSGNPVVSMRSQLRRLIADHGIDLVVVDYLQLIDSSTTDKRKSENRVNEIGEITRGLKGIAKEFDVPVLALAQLSRAVEGRASKSPMLSDLRESGSIENDADIVMFVYRQDYYDEREGKELTRPNQADVIIAKHRNGPCGTVVLHFKANQTRFYNLEKEMEG